MLFITTFTTSIATGGGVGGWVVATVGGWVVSLDAVGGWAVVGGWVATPVVECISGGISDGGI